MENASKALIIAGAILLSILIIGLGMFIYNQAANAMDTKQIDQQKVDAYNSSFLKYDGNQLGTAVKTLISNIEAHNRTAQDISEFITVTNTGTAPTANGATEGQTGVAFNGGFATIKSGIRNGQQYKVQFGYDANTGYIIGVDIKATTNP